MRTALSLFTCAFVLIGAACGIAPGSGTAERDSTALWPYYRDLADLTAAADLVVEAVVVRRLGEREVRGHSAQRVPVAFTDSLVRVANVLKGEPGSEELRVAQIGREGDPAQTYPEFPVLSPGSHVVLFLVDVSEEAAHADGSAKYGILPPVGLFTVEGQRLRSAAAEFSPAREATSLSLDDFRARVRALADR